MSDVPGEADIHLAWTTNRPRLVDLAFRMLGDIGEAEDIVQEAFSRLARTDLVSIDDARGWLTVVTSRLCLDWLRSARSRRERPHDLARSEAYGAFSSPHPGIDPADRVTLDDSVRLALLVVLERLSPSQRVVFVLHDIFQMPFDEIAETVGRPIGTCRQLARRARQRVQKGAEGKRFDVAASEHRIVTERFIAACANGDLEALLQVLDPEVSGEVDLGAAPGPGIIHGAEPVSTSLLAHWGPTSTMASLPIDRQPAVLAFRDRRLAGVLLLRVASARPHRVAKVHVIADPAKLAFLRSQLSDRP